ncbi:MAG TPA: hypothetical protein VGJ41_03745 [Nocardioides sp.]
MTRLRSVVSGLVSVATASALVLGVAPEPAGAGTADAVLNGYRIHVDDRAQGSWVGSRKASTHVVYRLDPTAKPYASGFGAVHEVKTLTGTGARNVSRRDTQRAAWILSTYGRWNGSYKEIQAAAVDISLDTLLVGGRWGWRGTKTKARLRQTGQAKFIRQYASAMLSQSKRYAGPYRLNVYARGTDQGGTVQIRARLTAAVTGAALKDTDVTVTYDGKSTQLRTDAEGRVTAYFPANRAGDIPIKVVAHRMPYTNMMVRNPVQKSASRVAVAGLREPKIRRTTVPVIAWPAVSIKTPSPTRITNYLPGTFTVAGSAGTDPRQATGILYGPYDSLAQAVCAETSQITSGTVEINGNGTYRLPKLKVARYGIYIWKVVVAGNRLNHDAQRCGGKTLVKSVARVTIEAPYANVDVNTRFRALMKVYGIPDGYSDLARVQLFGPFKDKASVHCYQNRVYATKWQRVETRGGQWTNWFKSGKRGYYGWQASIPGSKFSTAAISTCRADGTFIHIQ